ncbi:hypothetical protein NDK50_07760 [Paraburkholderia bryophila]|uniref:hypothetical protein n=1 Tax=Paraburkholderia bryophila TaxID=420952 RepID=UPI002349CB4E|nr:hypothetical protein [Paraburkholderia bryophila]WCM22061.1 hypothetical protein NDK50_07760 [Paraburkholderia bryophila]
MKRSRLAALKTLRATLNAAAVTALKASIALSLSAAGSMLTFAQTPSHLQTAQTVQTAQTARTAQITQTSTGQSGQTAQTEQTAPQLAQTNPPPQQGSRDGNAPMARPPAAASGTAGSSNPDNMPVKRPPKPTDERMMRQPPASGANAK